MIARIYIFLGVLIAAVMANAQTVNCVKSMSLTSPSATAPGNYGNSNGKCVYNNVSVSNYSYTTPVSPEAHLNALNQSCVQKLGCPPPIPPPIVDGVSTGFKSQYMSAMTSLNLVSVKFQDRVLDPRACSYITNSYSAVLDKNHPKNAIFFQAYPFAGGQWIQMTLVCPSAPVKSSTGAVTFSSGCYVDSYSSASRPPSVYCF